MHETYRTNGAVCFFVFIYLWICYTDVNNRKGWCPMYTVEFLEVLKQSEEILRFKLCFIYE